MWFKVGTCINWCQTDVKKLIGTKTNTRYSVIRSKWNSSPGAPIKEYDQGNVAGAMWDQMYEYDETAKMFFF